MPARQIYYSVRFRPHVTQSCETTIDSNREVWDFTVVHAYRLTVLNTEKFKSLLFGFLYTQVTWKNEALAKTVYHASRDIKICPM